MSGHTPGPWFVAPTPPEWDRQVIMAKRTGGACGVADVYLPPYPEGGEANARLIAAAPRMYEALEEIAGSHGCCQTEGCCEDNPMCDTMVARAALREAREES